MYCCALDCTGVHNVMADWYNCYQVNSHTYYVEHA